MDDKTHQLLQQLADKLGTTAEFLWGVLIKQAHVYFWTDLIFYLITVVVVYYSMKIAARWGNKAKQFNDEEDMLYALGCGAMMVIAILFVLVSIFSISDTLTKVINPEYWALQQIIKTVK